MQKTKTQISFAVTAKLISAFVFAIRIVKSLYFLNPKFQASSHLLWLYSLVCVGPGRKPRRPVFSGRDSIYTFLGNVQQHSYFAFIACPGTLKDVQCESWGFRYAECPVNEADVILNAVVARKDSVSQCAYQGAVTAQLISAFVFAIRIVQSLYYLNPKFQACSHILWLYSQVCVGPGRKPDCWFSHDAAHILMCIFSV